MFRGAQAAFLLVFMSSCMAAAGQGANIAPQIGESCKSSDTSKLCVGVRYVSYVDAGGAPAISADDVVSNIQKINKVWAQCGIAFQIDSYLAVNPSDYNLQYNISTYPELDDIRNRFNDGRSLLVVTTGAWNRSGTLGNTSANAWTSMPGSGPYGAVLERPVATYANIVAHELGHYLNLYHVSMAVDLMNPIIYTDSTTVKSDQCSTARSAVQNFWQMALR